MKSLVPVLFTLCFLSACGPSGSETRPALENVARAGGDSVVARVSETELFASDVDLAAQEQGLVDDGVRLPKSDENYRQILDELIDQRLLALDAERQGLNGDREAKIRLAAARERILGNIRVERHLRETVNEASIRKIYEEQSKLAARGDEVRARHILVKEKVSAEELLGKIQAGEDFAESAISQSIDIGSAERGGDLGYFTQDMLTADFTSPVFQATKGALIGPIETEYGWHIAEVLDRRPVAQPNFETLKPEITNFMTFDAIQDLLTELREGAEVVILDDAIAVDDAQADTQEKPSEDESDEN